VRIFGARLSSELYYLPRLFDATLYGLREVAMQHPIVALRRALLLIAVTAAALAGAGNTLDIYFIDTEGSQATLLVSPTGETFMIDVGFAGFDTPNPDNPAHYLKVSATEDVPLPSSTPEPTRRSTTPPGGE
jgi:hypothetical protein